eukprot:gene6001-6239_t
MSRKLSCPMGARYEDFISSLQAGELQYWAARQDSPYLNTMLGSNCGTPNAVPTTGGVIRAADNGSSLESIARVKRHILLFGGVLTSMALYTDLPGSSSIAFKPSVDFIYTTSSTNNNVPNAVSVNIQALFCFGWSDAQQYWLCKNSFGPDWGQPGGVLKIAYGAAFIMQSKYTFGVEFAADNRGRRALARLRANTSPDPVQSSWTDKWLTGAVLDVLTELRGPSTEQPFKFCGLVATGVVDPFRGQQDALLALKATIDPNNFFLASWAPAAGGPTAAKAHCTWQGISCDQVYSEVTSVVLPNLSLGGTAPDAFTLQGLPFMDTLDLSNCSLGGQLPSNINSRFSLSRILLANNNITGTLPTDWAELSVRLTVVDLSGNQLEGSLPEEWGLLENLYSLRLANNQFSPTIPFSWGDMSSLAELDLSHNKLMYSLPTRLPRFLQRLVVEGNAFEGTIPEGISSLSKLREIRLGNNRFSGTLPSGDSWSAVTVISFEKNQLTGGIPETYGTFAGLRELRLQENKLQGDLPDLALRRLQVLHLHNNDPGMSGFVPKSWGQMMSLDTVTLYNNPGIRGCLPETWMSRVNQIGSGFRMSDLFQGTGITLVPPFCSSNKTAPTSSPSSPAIASISSEHAVTENREGGGW